MFEWKNPLFLWWFTIAMLVQFFCHAFLEKFHVNAGNLVRDPCDTGWWWLEHDFNFSIWLGNVIIPVDELIFFRGVRQSGQYFIEISCRTGTGPFKDRVEDRPCRSRRVCRDCGWRKKKTQPSGPSGDQFPTRSDFQHQLDPDQCGNGGAMGPWYHEMITWA